MTLVVGTVLTFEYDSAMLFVGDVDHVLAELILEVIDFQHIHGESKCTTETEG